MRASAVETLWRGSGLTGTQAHASSMHWNGGAHFPQSTRPHSSVFVVPQLSPSSAQIAVCITHGALVVGSRPTPPEVRLFLIEEGGTGVQCTIGFVAANVTTRPNSKPSGPDLFDQDLARGPEALIRGLHQPFKTPCRFLGGA